LSHRAERFLALAVGDRVCRGFKVYPELFTISRVVAVFDDDVVGRCVVVRNEDFSPDMEVLRKIAFAIGPWRFDDEFDASPDDR